ncbi:MAG: hypothetical protein II417_01585 [Elusimicrobia bacterium]|nr:hypothetical protein [Elusimicrobiota bacterium]
MLGKIIDGRLVVAGRVVKEGNTTITNPTEEKLKELGYKEIEYTEKPNFNKEEEKLQEVYTDGETITVSYEVVELSAEEHNAIIQQEIVTEENKITARNVRNAIMGDNFAKNKITEVENNIAELRAKIREITPKEEE